MQFGVLGPLEVIDGDRSVELGGSQPRTLLAMLVAAAGRIVATEALIDAIWGEDPPTSAAGTLQSYVSRLRRGLEPERGRGQQATLLLHEPPGYRLDVGADQVDFRRFEALADRGRSQLGAGEHEAARRTLIEAEALWRGPAFSGYRDLDFAMGLAARLDDRRVAATEDRIAAALAVGHHAAVIGELSELVQDHPLREGLRGHLALALYRAGRQAEALRAIDDARCTLREELGVDLSRPLIELEAAILDQDPALDAPAVRRTGSIRSVSGDPGAGPGAGHDAAPSPGSPGGPRFVGRARELDDLRAAWAEARSATRAAVVEGEPGIGKTRLVEELCDQATAEGALVLWGRAFEGGAAPAFWPWLPPLRALAEELAPGTGLSPEIAGLLTSEAATVEVPASDASRFALFDAVVALLASTAAVRPVVLVIDDIQWADPASLQLVASVAARLTDVPLLLLATVRELEVGRNDVLVETLAVLSRHSGARRILLRGLTEADTAELVAQAAGDSVDPSTSALIHGRAEGNPFFITELARLLASGTALDEVPSGVRDVVRRRLALLPEATARLLDVAATIGRDVDVGLLASVAGTDLDTCLDDLEPAIIQRLLVPIPEQPLGYRFVHALVREVVVDGMSTLRRARLHLRVADHLPDTDDTAEILAEHLWEAVPIGAGSRAADALVRAAQVAIRRLAYDSALDLLERAVPLRRTAGSTVEDKQAELDALVQLISVIGARRGLSTLVGSPLLSRGRSLASETGAELALTTLVWVEWAALNQSGAVEASERVARDLLERAAASDELVVSAIAHAATGITAWERGRIAEAMAHMEIAAAHTRDLEGGGPVDTLFDRDQVRLALPFEAYLGVLVEPLDADHRRGVFDDLAGAIPDDPYWELIVRAFEASAQLIVGDGAECERAARRALANDPTGGFNFWSFSSACYLGAALCLQHRFDEGVEVFETAWDQYAATGSRVNGVTCLSAVALGFAGAGRVEEAEAYLARGRDLLVATGERFAEPVLVLAEAQLLALAGDHVGAARTARAAHDLAVEQGSRAVAARILRDAEDLGIAGAAS